MKRSVLAILFFVLCGFVSNAVAYDTCVAYHSYNNPNPTLPCSYNGYDYDSLAVEAGVNSFFYKGEKYVLTDYDWWWYLASPEYETQDGILYAWGSWHPEYYTLSFSKNGALFFGAGASYTYTLTILVNPGGSGDVEVDDTSCSSYPCETQITPNTEVSVTATPESNYAFAYWDDGTTNFHNNPLTVEMSGNKTLTAKFFKTFRASAGSFRAAINDSGGQCVPYVRYETDIPWDDFNGDADSTYQQAINAGYATSATVPRISSVIVFASQSGMPYGHVGIVTAINGNSITIRDSNWNLDEKVTQHTEDISSYSILGYIYYTP